MVGVALLVFCLVAWFCVLWWNRGILDEVTKASYGRAVTGTAVMARSANEEKKNCSWAPCHAEDALCENASSFAKRTKSAVMLKMLFPAMTLLLNKMIFFCSMLLG